MRNAFIIMIAFLLVLIIYLEIDEGFVILDRRMTRFPNFVIVSSHYNEDTEWLKKTTYPVVLCSKVHDSPNCQMNINKGREASGYLKFIIDNYYRLPKHIAFIHGHETSIHQTYDIMHMISKCAKYTQFEYISLSLYNINFRERENPGIKLLHELWDEYFRPYLNRDPPTQIFHDCCAQFIVSRDRIRSRPINAYRHWYNLTIDQNYDDYVVGLMFEYIWHIIFGEPDVVSIEDIMQQYYKIDGCP